MKKDVIELLGEAYDMIQSLIEKCEQGCEFCKTEKENEARKLLQEMNDSIYETL